MALQAQRTRPTSLDVAQRAGLSRSTVSQVLNGNGLRFPKETRDRVEAAATELGYRPSRAGRALVTGVSDIIVVAVPNVTFGRHLQDAVDRIAKVTAVRGMSVVVRYAGDDEDATLTAVLDLRPFAVVDLGVFYADDARRALEAGGTIVVPELGVVNRIPEDPNHFIGGLQARHMLEDPERRLVVAVLDDDRLDFYGPERVRGITDVAADLGLTAPVEIAVPLTRSGAVAALSTAVAQSKGSPLGICCYNDDVAIALLAAARDLGFQVPTDIAVIGVDHTAIGQLVDPPLTTISVDMPRIISGLIGELGLSGDLGEPAEQTSIDFEGYVQLHRGGSS
jgi:DNA-binding LacI/PurR family transcriptional regulator